MHFFGILRVHTVLQCTVDSAYISIAYIGFPATSSIYHGPKRNYILFNIIFRTFRQFLTDIPDISSILEAVEASFEVVVQAPGGEAEAQVQDAAVQAIMPQFKLKAARALTAASSSPRSESFLLHRRL